MRIVPVVHAKARVRHRAGVEGGDEEDQKRQDLARLRPQNDVVYSQVRGRIRGIEFAEIFKGGDAAMVPAPKSSLIGEGDLWVPYNMAAALVEPGLGSGVVPCIRRTKSIQKAALSRPADRPGAATHRATIAVEAVAVPGRAVIVDDVVTTGAMLMGAAQALRSAFPGVEIAAFAAMRTAGFGNFRKTRDPKVETIYLYPSGKTFRK